MGRWVIIVKKGCADKLIQAKYIPGRYSVLNLEKKKKLPHGQKICLQTNTIVALDTRLSKVKGARVVIITKYLTMKKYK